MDNKPPKVRWATSSAGQIVGYLMATTGFSLWTIAEGRGNGGYYAFGGMMALEPAAILGALGYLAAVAKPFSDKRLFPMVFGVGFMAVSLFHAW